METQEETTCPDWCTADHRDGYPVQIHERDIRGVLLGKGNDPYTSKDYAWASPQMITYRGEADPAAVQMVGVPDPASGKQSAHLGLSAKDARNAADLIEMLSGGTKAQQKEYAAKIREAADIIDPQNEPEAG